MKKLCQWSVVSGQLVLAALMALGLSVPMGAGAQSAGTKTSPQDYWGGVGTVVSTNIAYFVAPACGGARAGITFLSAQTDNTSGKLKVYPITTSVLVTNSLAAGLTNLLVAATNGFAVGDVIIIRSVTNDTYQKAIVGPTISAAGFVITNDLTSATTSFAVFEGDVIYRCGTPASVLISNTRADFSGSGNPIFLSGVSQPLLVEAASLSVNATNNVIVAGGKFIR